MVFILSCLPAGTACIGADTNRPGSDWPIFRGDSSLSGVAAGSLPDRFKLLWSFKIGSEVKSSPIIADGKVFIGASDSNVYAIALADGTQVWKTQLDAPVEAPPLFVDGAIFVGSTAGTLHALDAGRGGSRWQFKAEDKIVGSANWVRSADGKSVRILFGSYDNRIYAVDPMTGKKVWSFETKNYINGSPAADSNRVVFGGCDATLHAVSAADGTEQAEIGRAHV
jgi:outer membrane protein assembly factor BamB